MAKGKKTEQVKPEQEESIPPDAIHIEQVMAGLLKQMQINNRILADIHARLFPKRSMAGVKAEPFKS